MRRPFFLAARDPPAVLEPAALELARAGRYLIRRPRARPGRSPARGRALFGPCEPFPSEPGARPSAGAP